MFKKAPDTSIDAILIEIQKIRDLNDGTFNEEEYRAKLQKQYKDHLTQSTYKRLTFIILVIALWGSGFQYGKKYAEKHILPSKIEKALKHKELTETLEAIKNKGADT